MAAAMAETAFWDSETAAATIASKQLIEQKILDMQAKIAILGRDASLFKCFFLRIFHQQSLVLKVKF